MKAPKYLLDMQDQVNAGLNAFALQLVAESFADDSDKFGDENICFLSRAHGGKEVWFIMSKTQPTETDFDQEVSDPPGLNQVAQISKEEWIERYGGQALLDSEGFDVVPCLNCGDPVCHGWRVERRPA